MSKLFSPSGRLSQATFNSGSSTNCKLTCSGSLEELGQDGLPPSQGLHADYCTICLSNGHAPVLPVHALGFRE